MSSESAALSGHGAVRLRQERIHILCVNGKVIMDEIFQQFWLFPVDFTKPEDPFFAGRPGV